MSYRIMCGVHPILDINDEEMIVTNPRISLEVNKVGEGSFTIYDNHPNFDKIQLLKSIFEVSDEYGVIFRGRATGDTADFNNGLSVDLEGVMAFFNDSVVRPFDFPADVEGEEDYINSENKVEYFLNWLIGKHNSQVTYAQRFKLGVVTVSDPNNYITRSSQDYMTTWDVLRTRLFESSLGGYLCIRYEDDGNYIDYLSSFTETNEQSIVFGENLLDLTRERIGTDTYSAVIPLGANGLTIAGIADGDISGTGVTKSGDMLILPEARSKVGFICAPPGETTWDDVTTESALLERGIGWLTNRATFGDSITATAVDLHFADSAVRSLRIYKKVRVRSDFHDLNELFLLSRLELDLMSPQNTRITVGKTQKTFVEKTSASVESVSAGVVNVTQYVSNLRTKIDSVDPGGHPALINPDQYYYFGEQDSLDIWLVTKNDGYAHEYMFEFIASENFTDLTIEPAVTFPQTPVFHPGYKYQVSILRGIGVMIGVPVV